MSETDTIEREEEEIVETNPIEDLVNQITAGELNKAEGSFKSILDDKLADALDAARVQVGQGIFDTDEEDSEDITDEELTDEELEAVDTVMDEDEDILAELEDDDIEDDDIEEDDVEVEDEVVDEITENIDSDEDEEEEEVPEGTNPGSSGSGGNAIQK